MSEYNFGPFRIRDNWGSMPKGQVIPGHRHKYDHVTVVWKGAIKLRSIDTAGNEHTDFHTAPAKILVGKGVLHEITSQEDGTRVECWLPHRNNQGMEIADYDGNEDAYA